MAATPLLRLPEQILVERHRRELDAQAQGEVLRWVGEAREAEGGDGDGGELPSRAFALEAGGGGAAGGPGVGGGGDWGGGGGGGRGGDGGGARGGGGGRHLPGGGGGGGGRH